VVICVNLIMGGVDPTPVQFVAADVNYDARIDLFDVLGIADLVSGGERQFRLPERPLIPVNNRNHLRPQRSQ
jgi:hypothetical protein